MSVEVQPFGGAGRALGKVFRVSAGAYSVELIEYGARIKACFVPDAVGRVADVVPGFDTPEDYLARGGSTGAICGRFGNRISDGKFELDGKTYQLSVNEGTNSIHGGFRQYAKQLWAGEATPEGDGVTFRHFSPAGDEGWPGNLLATVTYRLTAAGLLTIEMAATTDAATYVNLIYHGYWNLDGHDAGSIDQHLMQIDARTYLPKNAANVPTGEFAPVDGTPFDFRTPKPIGRDVAGLPGQGYDHNFCLDDGGAVTVRSPKSGRTLTLTTDQPGVQVFTANSWSNVPGKGGAIYQARAGVALETQVYPNGPNIPTFGLKPLRPGDIYRHRMAIQFGATVANG